MNKLLYLQAEQDILQAGLDAYKQVHPHLSDEEQYAFCQVASERDHLSDLIHSLSKNPQTKPLREWLDTFRKLGVVDYAVISANKSNGALVGNVECPLSTAEHLLSPAWLNHLAYVNLVDEDNGFVQLFIEIDE